MADLPARRQLIDQWGNPISVERVARLRQHEALPRPASSRSPFSTYQPTDGLTPASLGAILKQASLGQSQQFMELLEEIEEKDLHYAAQLSTRKRQVAQLPIRVTAAGEEPAQQEQADFLRKWLKTSALDAALEDMLDGISKGFSVLETIWQTKPGQVWPMRLVYRPQRHFEVDWRDGDTIQMREAAGLVPLTPHKFVVHRHPSKSGLILRAGLGRVAVWGWMMKQFTLQDWAIFVHNYGAPIRVGRYGPESTNEDRAVLWRAVSNVAGDMAAIIPKSMEMEFIELGDVSKGGDLYESRCRFLDEQISKLVLGQTATTDAAPGSHAAGKTHRLVQEDIERADAKKLATTVNRQLVPQIIAFNFGPQVEYPTVEIGHPDEVPLERLISAVKDLGPLGLRVKSEEMHSRLGTTPPEPTDTDVIGGRPSSGEPPAEGPGAAEASGGAAPPRPTQLLKRLVQLQFAQPDDDTIDAQVERMADDAAGILHGLTEDVLIELEAADDMADLGRRLAKLQLDPTQLGLVLGRGLALANLVGQASIPEG